MKDFFSQKWVRIVASLLVVIGTIALLIGGVKIDDIKNISVLAGGVVTAILAIIAFIASLLSPKTEKKE